MPEGLDRGGATGPPRPVDHPAAAGPARRCPPPSVVGRGAEAGDRRDPPVPAAVRVGLGRGVRRRRPYQREGLPAEQVRPRRAPDQEHRLQRPFLHVLGGHRRPAGAGGRPGPAVSRRRPGRGRGRPADRQQPGRDHAPRHAVLRRTAPKGRSPDRRRSSDHPDGGHGGAAPPTAAGDRPRHRQRTPAPPGRYRVHRRGLHRRADCGVRRGAGWRPPTGPTG